MTSPDPVGWIGCLDDLRAIAERLADQARTAVDSTREVDVAVKVFGTIMGAYLTHLWAEPDHPAFLPSVGYHQMYGSPNPDTIYRSAAIDGTGDYRIVGSRGTAPDVTIMPFGAPVTGGLQTFEPFDLDDLSIDHDGTFDVVLSGRRPVAERNWWRIEPDMRTLMLRSVSDRWGEHTDPRVAIVRLDADPRRLRSDPAAFQRRFRSYASVVEAMVMSGVNRVVRLRDDGVVNRVVTVDYSATGGGLDDQWYQEGCFALEAGEALLVEARGAAECTAFSLSLTDAAFSTIDWANAQSSLNRDQATIDADGVLRVVVATRDPGVGNWLDTTGHRNGALQFRWSGTRAAPDVSIRVMPAAALGGALPESTVRVSPEQRGDTIRAREVGVQLRTRW